MLIYVNVAPLTTAEFRDLNGDASYDGTNETLFFDDYNNKDKARSLWISVNVRF